MVSLIDKKQETITVATPRFRKVVRLTPFARIQVAKISDGTSQQAGPKPRPYENRNSAMPKRTACELGAVADTEKDTLNITKAVMIPFLTIQTKMEIL